MRRLAFVILLVACAWVFVRPTFSRRDTAFDPLEPHGREVERAIEQQRYGDALPLALDLQSRHPDDPVIAYWIAESHGGLGHFEDAGREWARVLALTHEADAACPAMPEAYERAGQKQQALEAYERCAEAGSSDPERWLDLARAYDAAGRHDDAGRAWSRARALDPEHPDFTTAHATGGADVEGAP